MNDKNRSRPRREGTGRPQSSPPRRPSRPRGPSAESLLEIADELEEQARSLLGHARQLQRMAASLEEGESARPARGRGGAGGGARGRSRSGEQDDREPRQDRRSGAAPAWAPAAKRRRS